MNNFLRDGNRTPIIILAIIVFMALSLWIRSLSQDYLLTAGNYVVFGADSWFNLRQIEVMVQDFPSYSWFDPMTTYPTGKEIAWGPLFPLIASVLCLLMGATARPEFVYVASWTSPILAALAVPVAYLIGAQLRDEKTGLAAALIIAVAPSSYVFRTLFGYVDHHGAEVLFSTIFCLCYITSLRVLRKRPLSRENPQELAFPVLIIIATGIAYLLGLLVMPTIVLFALITGIYTIVQYAINATRGERDESLAALNTGAFAVPVLYLLLFGIEHDGFGLSLYSAGHVAAYLFLIGATLALWLITQLQDRRSRITLTGIIIALSAVISLYFSSELAAFFVQGPGTFFGQSTVGATIREMEPWSLEMAWASLNLGLIFLVLGLATIARDLKQEMRPELLFLLIWAVFILISTILHQRYEYYLSIVVALLSGIAITHFAAYGWQELNSIGKKSPYVEPEKIKSKKKKNETAVRRKNPGHAAVSVLAIIGLIIFIGVSISGVLANHTAIKSSEEVHDLVIISDDWYEALEWLGDNTPDPGVAYHGPYERYGYSYPNEAYGVLSWWDTGHWITFISKRIPNTNPFQDNLQGPNGAAAYFMSVSEEDGNDIIDVLGSRYIVTDYTMATKLYQQMETIADLPENIEPLQKKFEYNNQEVTLLTTQYFASMLARLHIYDGSAATATEVYYIEYRDQAGSNPVITKLQKVSAEEGRRMIEEFEAKAGTGVYAELMSDRPAFPAADVAALTHYRLVYESDDQKQVHEDAQPINDVKIFEYVPAARITGEGEIELELMTNTGRTFTYRQESVNGIFVVPYSTEGNPYPVKAVGKYRIVETGQEFSVTEDDVQKGLTVA